MNPSVTQFKRGGPGRPQALLSELAKEFGVSVPQLKGYMRHHPGAPAPSSKVKSMTAADRTYYDPLAMRKWWKGVQR